MLGAFAPELVGVAGLSLPEQRQARHKATLFGMAVAPEAGGNGVGRMLVEKVKAEARLIPGVRQIVLTVTLGNESAERLYRSCGFVRFGVEPRAVIVEDAGVDKVHMVCMLDG